MVTYDEKDEFRLKRAQMVKSQLQGRNITDQTVLDAMAQLPREEFITPKYARNAYDDHPLPIGMGQTISQPYIVALMTQYLDLAPDCSVLELGTGSGYQTAILAKLAKQTYTIERFHELSELAQTALARLDITNIEFYIGDGSNGWPHQKTFDRIIVTAAVPQIPETLTDQLNDNGILVAPVGPSLSQDLIVCQKQKNKLYSKSVCPCRFVKLIGKHGFKED